MGANAVQGLSNATMKQKGVDMSLRSSEKAYLKHLRAAKKERDLSVRNQHSPYQHNYEMEYEQCQTALKKMDVLTIEIADLKSSSSVDTKKLDLKIRSLDSQIKRYQTQAKEFCPRDILQDSQYFG